MLLSGEVEANTQNLLQKGRPFILRRLVFTDGVRWRLRLPLQPESRRTQKLFRARSPLRGNRQSSPRTPFLASGRHLSGNPTNQACAYGYPEETSRYRLPPANRSRRVCLCVAQTQNTPHSRIPLNAHTKSGDQDVEVTEKKQFPFRFFRWVELGAWQRQTKGPGEKTALRRIKNSGVICCARSRNQNGNPG